MDRRTFLKLTSTALLLPYVEAPARGLREVINVSSTMTGRMKTTTTEYLYFWSNGRGQEWNLAPYGNIVQEWML